LISLPAKGRQLWVLTMFKRESCYLFSVLELTFSSSPGTCSTPVSFTDANPYSFGDPFNQNGGGIYATSWDSNSIKIWFWSADMTAPSDIFSASPDPTTWGPPIADFEGCSDDTNFKNNRIVFDTNFCNAAANAAFAADSTCSSSANSCQEFITQFPDAYDQSCVLCHPIVTGPDANSTNIDTGQFNRLWFMNILETLQRPCQLQQQHRRQQARLQLAQPLFQCQQAPQQLYQLLEHTATLAA
jgi:hypothetical protein